jgi:serine phosphatase RsbU (regulator of sigma subunit)
MNAQLSDDLREGHFITAWFGLLDTRDHSLLSLSCGQAPILHYVSAEARCALLGADAPPLGFDDALDLDGAASIRLGPGDVVVVLSDGIFEARNARHVEFGAERVVEVLRATCEEPAPKILRALRAALEDFAGDTPAADDRTALVVRRTA